MSWISLMFEDLDEQMFVVTCAWLKSSIQVSGRLDVMYYRNGKWISHLDRDTSMGLRVIVSDIRRDMIDILIVRARRSPRSRSVSCWVSSRERVLHVAYYSAATQELNVQYTLPYRPAGV